MLCQPSFSDTFSNLTLVNSTSGVSSYNFSEVGIAWPGEAGKYSATTNYNLSDIVPPPNWALRYPQNYNSSNFPNLQADEHFQNWMRTAGLPTFSKLYGRSDNKLLQGTYQLTIGLSTHSSVFRSISSLVTSLLSQTSPFYHIKGPNRLLYQQYLGLAARTHS